MTEPRPIARGPRATLDSLDTPAVLVDLDRMERNLADMQALAVGVGVRLRPHAKTHKSGWIAQQQLRHGAAGLSVAKLGEAEAMAAAGVDDLLIAYPILGETKLTRLEALARRVRVICALDDLAVAEGLSRLASGLAGPLEVYVQVDSGQHREGLPPEDAATLGARVAQLPALTVRGVMTHGGHGYVTDPDARRRAALDEGRALTETAERLERHGVRVPELSVGSTPTAPHLAEVKRAFPRVTEARPGTYVFFDARQVTFGVAPADACALTVLATVVSRPAPDRALADAGSKTLAGDPGPDGTFGRVLDEPRAVVANLSEEHAWLRIDPAVPWRVGDRIRIVPNHACPVPNLADVLLGVRGDRVEREIAVDARGRNR